MKMGMPVYRSEMLVFEVITPCKPGTKVALYIRPEEVTIAVKDGDLPKTSVRNQLSGTITKMVPFGPFVRTTIDFGSHADSTGDPPIC